MVLIVFLMLIGGVLESLSISAVIPVVEALVVENAVEENRILSLVYETLGLTSKVHLTVIMMVSLILLFVLKNLFLFFQQVVQMNFVYTNQFNTSRRMMINFMKRPYEYYLGADTAVIQRSITSDVNNMYDSKVG